jgi:competence protein ComEC
MRYSVPLGLISGQKTFEITKRPLIPALLFFILGIIAGRFIFSHNQWLSFSFVFLISILLNLTILLPYFSSRTLFSFSILFFIGVILFQIAGIQNPRLLQLAEGHKKIVLDGTVLSPGNIAEERSKFDFMVESVLIDQTIVSLRERVTVTIYKNAMDFNPGQRIRFPASLKSFRNFNNPGRYDYEATMNLRGYSCAASVSDGRTIVLMGKEQTGFIVRAMESVRGPIRKLMINNLGTVDQAVYRALILGEMQGIDDDLRESFNITGLGHVLSVSGLHVGLVAVVSFALFRFLFSFSYAFTLRIDIRKLAALITSLCVFTYTFIAGFQVSANRSMIMAITYLFSIIVGKEKDAWSTLALAAIIVLSLDPNDLFNISFQLSFIAVIGIFWLSPYIYKLIKNKFNELERGHFLSRVYIYFSTLLVIGFSAVICSLPFTTYYFHRIQLLAIPINLIVEPILGLWILPIGLLSVVFLPVSYTLSCLVLKIGALGLDVMMNIIQFWSQFDWIAVWTVTPDMLEIVLYYCVIFFLIFTIRKQRWAQVGLVIALTIGICDVSFWIYDTRFNPNLRVTFLDVGQGNSAFIQFPRGKNLLLDSGGFTNNTFDTGRMIVAPFLFQAKIHRVDYFVLSHPHPDHLNGMKFIADHFNPKIFLYNGQKINAPEFTGLIDTLKKNNTEILLPEDLLKGIDINGVRVELLHPTLAVKAGEVDLPKEDDGTNNNSLVLKISYKENSFLFPGDIQIQGEEAVVTEAGPSLKSNVLLVPHHGSKFSSTMPFLKAVSPKIAIISCGKENSFGFPSLEALKRLGEIGSEILRIDECGAITIEVDSKGMKIERFLNPTQPD